MLLTRFIHLYLVLISVFVCNLTFAQDLSVKWSQELEFSPRKLYFNRVLGEDNSNVYVLFTSDTTEHLMRGPDKMKLIAYDRQSLIEIASIPLKGFPEVVPEMEFHTCVIWEDKLLIFWSKNNGNTEELYLETFDSHLKTSKSARKICSNNHANDLRRAVTAKHVSTYVVCQNVNRKQELLIGTEIPSSDNYIRFEYTVLDNELNTSPFRTVELPLKTKNTSFGLSATYEFLENGNLLVRGAFTADDDKGVTKNTGNGGIVLANVNPYHTLSYLKVESGEISTVELPIKTVSFKMPILKSVFVENQIRVFGLYSDEESNKEGVKGIFCAKFNLEDLATETEYIQFKQATLDSLNEKHDTKFFYLQNVILNKGRILFFVAPVIFDYRMVRVSKSAVIGYDLNHEYQWMNTIKTTPNQTIFFYSSNQDEIDVFYACQKTDQSKMIVRSTFGENTIGISTLNSSTGKLTESGELSLDKPIVFRNTYFANRRLYMVHFESNLLMSGGSKGQGNLGVISYE